MTNFLRLDSLKTLEDSFSSDDLTLALTLLRRISMEISQAPTFETALLKLLELVCNHTHWIFGEIWLPSAASCSLVHSGLWYSSDSSLGVFGQCSQDFQFSSDSGLPGRVWFNQKAEWLSDVAHCSTKTFHRRDLALELGLGAGLGVPVTLNNETLMVLVFFMKKVKEYDVKQIYLVEAIAAQVGSVLRLKRTEEELLSYQQHLQRLFDTLPGIVFTAEGPPQWKMKSLSKGCKHLTGYAPEELIGPDKILSYNDITHPDDFSNVQEAILSALTQGTFYEAEYRLITRDGGEKWVWEKGHGLFDSLGKVNGIEGFITEITALKHTEAALRESETRYRLLAERSQDIISQHDLSGEFQYVSPACRNLLGYQPAELVGQSPQQWLHPADKDRVLSRYRQFLRQKTVQTLRFRMRHRDGDYRWFETISGMIDEAGTSGDRQILAVSRDITDRVKAEQSLIDREYFLTLVLDNIPQRLFWKDRHGTYLGCNQAFVTGAGLQSSRDVIGKTDDTIQTYSPEEARRFREQDQHVIQLNEPMLNLLEAEEDADAMTIRWFNCNKFPIHDANQQVVGVLGTSEDVSAQVVFRQTLIRREQYLTAIVELQRHLLDLDNTWDNDRFCCALQALGEAAEANRVHIYECEPDNPDRLLQRAQWVSPGTTQTYGHPAVAAFEAKGQAAEWVAQLQAGKCINQTLEQFPASLRTSLGSAPSSVKSILLLPLEVQGRFSGVVGFSNCETSREWSRSEVALLQIAANAIAIATERFQTELSLRQAEHKYRSIVENAVEGIFQTTLEGHYITVNPMLAKIFGYASPQEMTGSLIDIKQQLYVDPSRRDDFVRQMLAEEAVIGFESAVYRKDGDIIWVSESARTIRNATGQVLRFEGTVEDITERKKAELEIHQQDRLLKGVAQASQYLLTNPDITASISKVLEILGSAAQADRVYIYQNHPHLDTGFPAMSMRHEWTQTNIYPSMDQPHWQNQRYDEHGFTRWYRAFQAGQPIRGAIHTFPESERVLLALDNIRSILMVPIFIDQDLWGYIGFDACHEVRGWTAGEESILVTIAASIGGALKRRHTEEQMRHQAFHDPLTGLHNRIAFNQRLPLVVSAARRSRSLIAVMFLDLDRFKNINDTLGHTIGDELLIQATQRLKKCLRKDDMLSRWGGDEFTLILQNMASAQVAERIAQRLVESLKPPFQIKNQELYVTGSIGIAVYPTDGKDVTTLLQNADAAMYSAKASGRNTYRFYTSTLNSGASQQLILEKHLHQALQREEFRLFFQPQIDVHQGNISRVEALIRWHSPELGNVPPNILIPVAEEIGLIIQLGDWVLKQACCQLQMWYQQGFEGLRIAVNLSARQLQQSSLVSNIEQVLTAFDLPPHSLELEITETAALSDIDASIATLNQLRQLGTRIVMDDFGTGYSSLSYLKRLPFQGLKIDRSFVKDIPNDTQDIAMLRAVIALGQELQLDMVAEGVETPEQMRCLKELGCTNMQGYWFSRPLDASAMTAFLMTHWPAYTSGNVHG